MLDLIVLIPDHCLSIYFVSFSLHSNIPCSNEKTSLNGIMGIKLSQLQQHYFLLEFDKTFCSKTGMKS